MSSSTVTPWWGMEIESMPHFERSMQRIYAWYQKEIIDRPPVRFMTLEYTPSVTDKPYPSGDYEQKWFDAEFRVQAFIESLEGKVFLAETFPYFYPFIGVDAYAAFYGADLIFDEKTSWSTPCVKDWEDASRLKFEWDRNRYFRAVDELTRCALEHCDGKYLVGYTSLHPGVDCAAAWRGFGELCLDIYDHPEEVKNLVDLALRDFEDIFNHYDKMLKEKNQPSISWMCVPSFTSMHIPGCDFAAFVSPADFEKFCLPAIQREVCVADQNIFHVDGVGVANHIDQLLEIPEIDAFQWAQGMGDNRSILKWIPLIKKIQARKPLIVDVPLDELERFMGEVEPEGLLLWVRVEDDDEGWQALKRIDKWA